MHSNQYLTHPFKRDRETDRHKENSERDRKTGRTDIDKDREIKRTNEAKDRDRKTKSERHRAKDIERKAEN